MRRYANISETIPQPCRIFGTVLRPFCLGHHLLFTRLELPFHGNPLADSSPDNFFKAVCVCAATYEETLNALLAGEWNGVYAKWLERINKLRRGPIFFGREKHLVNSAKEYDLAKKVFSDHLLDGYRTPPVWRSDRGGAIRFTAPWEETFKCRLISAGFSETEVLNGYLPLRWYDYYTVFELEDAANCTDARKWREIFVTEQNVKAREVA